jgi:hypothetical protein
MRRRSSPSAEVSAYVASLRRRADSAVFTAPASGPQRVGESSFLGVAREDGCQRWWSGSPGWSSMWGLVFVVMGLYIAIGRLIMRQVMLRGVVYTINLRIVMHADHWVGLQRTAAPYRFWSGRLAAWTSCCCSAPGSRPLAGRC